MAKRIKHNRKNNVQLFIDHSAQNTLQNIKTNKGDTHTAISKPMENIN